MFERKRAIHFNRENKGNAKKLKKLLTIAEIFAIIYT